MFSTFSAAGVKRRIRRSRVTMTIGICTLASRLSRSLLTRLSSSLRPWSSSLRVLSSSLVDCSSSLAVSSSSLVDCSSSLLDRISSFADCSSSLAAPRSSMIDCSVARLRQLLLAAPVAPRPPPSCAASAGFGRRPRALPDCSSNRIRYWRGSACPDRHDLQVDAARPPVDLDAQPLLRATGVRCVRASWSAARSAAAAPGAPS